MRRSMWGFVVAVGMMVTLVACASAPKAEIDGAKAAVDQAVAAGAGEYAGDSLKAAQDASAALEAEVKAQEGKWFASYTKTNELAAAAKAAGEKAAADAVAGKAKAKDEATTAIANAKTVLAEAQALLDKAPKGKGTAADIEAMKTDLVNATTAITEAEGSLAGERFLDAKAKAESAGAAATTVKTAVEAAMAAKGKK
jgi:hypothetical protein